MRKEKARASKQDTNDPLTAEADKVGRFKLPPNDFPTPPPKVSKVRQSGHLVDQKLKYNDPTKNKSQLTLFELIDPNMLGEVEKFEVKYEGIRLTVSEERLLTAIYSLLKDKSEHKDSGSEKFYKGNYDTTEVVPFGGENIKRPHLRIIPSELYKAYLENEDYSGKEIRDINKSLSSLAEKRFLMTYDRVRTVKVGKKTENRTDRIEMFKRLIEIVRYTRDLTDEELAKLDKGDKRIKQSKGELIIALNPILTDQINSKYVEYPSDINRRTIIAAGGDHRNVTQAVNTLRDYMLRELSAKRYECEINVEKLPYLLKLDNYIKQGRKKLIKETSEKAIQACKNLNLILEVIETTGAEGQRKYVFKLNPDF